MSTKYVAVNCYNDYLLLSTFLVVVSTVVHVGWLTGFLDILGQAYAACALFNIGIFMVGKLKKLTGTVILVATLLIVAKTYVY